MLESEPPGLVTSAEYLAAERAGATRNEMVDGRVFPLSEVEYPDARLASNFATTLAPFLLGKPYAVFFQDIRVRTGRGFLYPEFAIVRDPIEFEDDERDTVLNPVVVVEFVLPGREGVDSSTREAEYKALPSLQEYLRAWLDRPRVEREWRPGEGWQRAVYEGEEARVKMACGDAVLPLALLYEGLSKATGP